MKKLKKLPNELRKKKKKYGMKLNSYNLIEESHLDGYILKIKAEIHFYSLRSGPTSIFFLEI
jgi:mRNA-degrading endonuclease RelE of RelBE toxin-antitoxin system